MKEVFVLASSSSSSGNGQARKLLLLRYDDDEGGHSHPKKAFRSQFVVYGQFLSRGFSPLVPVPYQPRTEKISRVMSVYVWGREGKKRFTRLIILPKIMGSASAPTPSPVSNKHQGQGRIINTPREERKSENL